MPAATGPAHIEGELNITGKDAVLEAVESTGVVAVVRIADAGNLVSIARALYAGGVRLIEVTMSVPGAIDVIGQATRELPAEVIVGVGTVLDPMTARLAIMAGARFVVGPTFDHEVAVTCRTYDCAVMAGGLTPTEILRAWRGGADIVKVFPGRIGTPAYFEDLHGPLPQIRLMPTGNVDLTTAPQYIRAGAIAVGVGKALVDPAAVAQGDFGTITENARRFRAVVDEARLPTSP